MCDQECSSTEECRYDKANCEYKCVENLDRNEIDDQIDDDTFGEMMINYLLAQASESSFIPMSLSLLPLTLKFLL